MVESVVDEVCHDHMVESVVDEVGHDHMVESVVDEVGQRLWYTATPKRKHKNILDEKQENH